jgi:hypothetical protein
MIWHCIFLPNCLLPLRLSDLWLLVPLCEDVAERGPDDGALELLRPLCPLLRGLLFDALTVLATVKNGPRHLARVPPHQVRLVRTVVHKLERLKKEIQIK